MLRKNLIILLIASLLIGFIVLAIQAILYPANWPSALTAHTLAQKDASHLELLWVQTVFAPSFWGRQLAATNGKVFFIGALSQKGKSGLVAVDSKNGNELWHVFDARIVEVGHEIVYTNSDGSVVAYTLTGKKLWQTKHWGKFINSLDLVDGKLYVESGYYYLMDAVTGDVLSTSSRFDSTERNYDPDLRWFFGVAPAFVNGLVFTPQGNYPWESAAIAYNKESGNILWRSEDNVISNVVATESLVFFITHEDELRILDASTGKFLEKLQIEPSINYFERETQPYTRVYQLAVDQTTQTLYVLLGDSNQLFAFRIHE